LGDPRGHKCNWAHQLHLTNTDSWDDSRQLLLLLLLLGHRRLELHQLWLLLLEVLHNQLLRLLLC
jgi:hypothetical protein